MVAITYNPFQGLKQIWFVAELGELPGCNNL